MKRIIFTIGMILLLGPNYQQMDAQKIRVHKQGAIAESDYFIENGVLYSAMVKIGFSKRCLNLPKGIAAVDESAISDEFPALKQRLTEVRYRWGSFKICKTFPNAAWGDTLIFNKNQGRLVRVPELSQRFRLLFDSLVPIDSVKKIFESVPEVMYTSPPTVFVDFSSPDDPAYAQQWELQAIQAPKAWDLTKGESSVLAAVVDAGLLGHQDLSGKIAGGDGLSHLTLFHGTEVAGVLAATTNNQFGIASLGWNIQLLTYLGGDDYSVRANKILSAATDGARVINLSWGCGVYLPYDECYNEITKGVFWSQDDPDVHDAVTTVQAAGVICVAAYGNRSENFGNVDPECDPSPIPYIAYPAAYSTIAVSGTRLTGSTEDGISEYNHGPLVTVAAPSWNVQVISPFSPYYTSEYGTSFGAPQVAALISLILSLNSDLSPNEVKSILTSTADKIGQEPYVNGRNDYLGYGRINAYAALKHTIEHYSTTIGGVGTTVVLHENFNTASGTTLTILPGTTVQIDPGYYLAINGSINATGTVSEPITFDRTGASGSWYGLILQSGSSGTVSYCNFSHATVGVSCNSSSPTISHCTFTGNYFGIYCNPCSPTIQYNDIENSTNTGIYLTGASPTIVSNIIRNSAQTGIWCNNSSSPPRVTGNLISGSGSAGVYCSNSSSPLLASSTFTGNNIIINNGSFGVEAYGSSNPMLGSYGASGFNSIYGNSTYDVAAYYGCTISARYNWWGRCPPISTQFNAYASTIDPSNALDYDPNRGGQKIQSPGELAASQELGPTADSSFNLAFQDDQAGRYEQAISRYLNVLSTVPHRSLLARQALLFLAESYARSGKTDFISYLHAQITPRLLVNSDLAAIARLLEARWSIKERRFLDAISIYRELHSEFSTNEEIDKCALFSVGEIYHLYLADRVKAAEALELFISTYPADRLATIASFLLEAPTAPFVQSQPSGGRKVVTKDPAPTGFALESNYPNPFNPSTQIGYSLPEAGKVSLVIYDVLGREIITLVDANQLAGRYTVTWNSWQSSGVPVASGIYFARLRVTNELGSVTFTKTTRLLLMK